MTPAEQLFLLVFLARRAGVIATRRHAAALGRPPIVPRMPRIMYEFVSYHISCSGAPPPPLGERVEIRAESGDRLVLSCTSIVQAGCSCLRFMNERAGIFHRCKDEASEGAAASDSPGVSGYDRST